MIMFSSGLTQKEDCCLRLRFEYVVIGVYAELRLKRTERTIILESLPHGFFPINLCRRGLFYQSAIHLPDEESQVVVVIIVCLDSGAKTYTIEVTTTCGFLNHIKGTEEVYDRLYTRKG